MAQVTLAFIGDVMLGRGVNAEIATRPPETFWGSTLPILRSADAVIANLECAITQNVQRWDRTPKVFYFRADPKATDVLHAARIRCVSLANNHTLDYGEEGLLDTLKHLDAVGICRAGAGRNLDEAEAPALFDAAGIKVGVVAFTDNEPPFAADQQKPGTNYIEIKTDSSTLARIEKAVKRAHNSGARIVVLSLHWGPNMVLRPPAHFREFASAAVRLGADILYGHSAHVFQGVQVIDGSLVMYDTGDFLDDYAVDPELRNDWSFIFLVEADETGPTSLRMFPVRLHYARVDLATGSEFEAICDRMCVLSSELGTDLRRTHEGLELTIRTARNAS